MSDFSPDKYASGWNLVNLSKLRNPPTWFAATFYILAFILTLSAIFLVVSAIARLALGASDYTNGAGADHARNLLIAVGALLAAPFVAWKTWIGHQQWRTSVAQVSVQDETLNTSLISKAIELLGSMREIHTTRQDQKGIVVREKMIQRNIEARTGAIILLYRIGKNSNKYRSAIISILTEYIASNTADDANNLERTLEREDDGENVLDGHEIEDLIPESPSDVNLCFQYIADLAANSINISDMAERRICLSGGLISGMDLTDTHLSNLDLSRTYLLRINFSGSTIENTILNASKMFGCAYQGANLKHAKILARPWSEFSNINDNTIFPDEFELVIKESSSISGIIFPRHKYYRLKQDTTLTGTPLPRSS